LTSLSIPNVILINPASNVANTTEQQAIIHNSYFKQERPNSSFININYNNKYDINISETTKSIFDTMTNLLYDHAMAVNNLNITCIP